MNTKYKNRKTRLHLFARRCMILMLLCIAQDAASQPLPPAVAHYPLRVNKYRDYIVAEPWDVSGNAHHGSTFDVAGDTLYDKSFKRINFPDTAVSVTGYTYPCLQKEVFGNGHINIPNVATANYTITFWIYFRSDMAGSVQTIVKLPNLQIQAYYGGIMVGINNGSTLTQKVSTGNHLMTTEGWYMVCVKSSDSTMVRKYQASGFAKTDLTWNVNGTPYSTGISQLLDQDCKGGYHNVRFYDQVLKDAQIDSIYKEDTLAAIKVFSPSSYVVKNVYAYYPLTTSDFKRNISRFTGRDGTTAFGVTGATDRYSRPDSAASFSVNNVYISLPAFWNTYMLNYTPYTNAPPNPKGFTISYWMNMTQSVSTPTGGIEMPFNSADHRTKIFYGRESNQDLFGMQQILDRLGIFRYNDITSTRYPWYLWFYDPLSLRTVTGWYHIVWVQYQDWMRMYVYKPDGTMFCNSYYIEIPGEIKNLTDWGLGNNAGGGVFQSLILDDFRIYNWPLDPQEVYGLDSLERPPSTPLNKSCGDCYTLGKEWESSISVPVNDKIKIYPNPASNKVNIQLYMNKDEQISVALTNIEGKKFLANTYELHSGDNIITLDDLRLTPGIYFVTVIGNEEISGTYKLTIVQ